MQSDQPTNGDLPENRKAAVAAGLEMYNAVAHERDELQKENRELRTQLAGLKVAMEAMDSNNIDMISQINTAKIERDQAVADRSVYETLFISIQAQLRAFAVPNVPLVKDRSDDNVSMQDQSVPSSSYDYGTVRNILEREQHRSGGVPPEQYGRLTGIAPALFEPKRSS